MRGTATSIMLKMQSILQLGVHGPRPNAMTMVQNIVLFIVTVSWRCDETYSRTVTHEAMAESHGKGT